VVDTIVSSVVGCGIKAQSTFETPQGDDVESINDERDKIWAEWAEVCEINGQYTLDEMQALAQREIVEAGEVLTSFEASNSTTLVDPLPIGSTKITRYSLGRSLALQNASQPMRSCISTAMIESARPEASRGLHRH